MTALSTLFEPALLKKAAALRRTCPSTADHERIKENTRSLALSEYSAPGGLREDPGRAPASPPNARTGGNRSHEMSVMLSKHGSRGDIEPMAGLAVRLRTLGAEVRVCAPRFCCLTVQRIACPAITRQ
jgi:hypothetical protein